MILNINNNIYNIFYYLIDILNLKVRKRYIYIYPYNK
jgi:hypothetical protein